jgi:hypothetical protein
MTDSRGSVEHHDATENGELVVPHAPDIVAEEVCRHGMRRIEFEWLGARDPALWNWLRITAPVRATAAEVAFALWRNPLPACGLTMAGSYAGVPPEWARRLAGASVYEPEVSYPAAPMALQLASSRIVDEIALSQVEHEQLQTATSGCGVPQVAAFDRVHLLETLRSTTATLEVLYREFKPWALHGVLVPAISFVRDKQGRLRHAGTDETAMWAPVVTRQHDVVRAATAGTRTAISLLVHTGLGQRRLDDLEAAAPHVLQMHAQAAGTSHLVETAQAALTRATLACAMLEAALHQRSELGAALQLHRPDERESN